MARKEDALDYHRRGRHGKIEVVPSKPLVSQIDLSLAYTPGVAEACLAIQDDPACGWFQQLQDGLTGGGFTAAAFADQP